MAWSYAYTRISDPPKGGDGLEEPATAEDHPDPSRWSRLRRYLPPGARLVLPLACLGLGLSALVLVAAGPSLLPLPPRRPDLPFDQCGGTPEEARRRGCRFEMHNFAWVPPACYDEELSAEWDAFRDWGFSRTRDDGNDTDADFVAECRAGNVGQAWVPWWQHMAHCDLILKKYIRSVMYVRPMDNWTSSWKHNEHCANMMTRYDVEPFFYNSLLHLKFPVCDYAWADNRPDPSKNVPKHSWHPLDGSVHDDEHAH